MKQRVLGVVAALLGGAGLTLAQSSPGRAVATDQLAPVITVTPPPALDPPGRAIAEDRPTSVLSAAPAGPAGRTLVGDLVAPVIPVKPSAPSAPPTTRPVAVTPPAAARPSAPPYSPEKLLAPFTRPPGDGEIIAIPLGPDGRPATRPPVK